jgi:hypothetical protein
MLYEYTSPMLITEVVLKVWAIIISGGMYNRKCVLQDFPIIEFAVIIGLLANKKLFPNQRAH